MPRQYETDIIDAWRAAYIAAASTNPLLSSPGYFGGIAVTETAAGAITVYDNFLYGDSTTRIDITNPSGSTFRYTFDGTGKTPGWSAASVPIGTVLTFAAQNFNAANNGAFVVTGSGTNYVEVTNASGVAEADKTIGTGNIRKGEAALTVIAVLKASIAENLHLPRPVLVNNGLTVVTAAASKIVAYYKV